MGPERAPQLQSPEEVERKVKESSAVLARSERLVNEYEELLTRAQRLLAEQRSLVKRFRAERRKRR
jgi:hypothetical protein